jgi:hypothetical protein
VIELQGWTKEDVMKPDNKTEETLRERFENASASDSGSRIDVQFRRSLRGSDRIEGIEFSRHVYASDDPADYPRVSPSRR